MNVLIVGGGGREHALSWKLSKSKDVKKIYIAPGNPGTAEVGENVDIKADDIDGLLKFAKENDIALTIVGPELPLTLGIVDIFEAAGLKAFGPSKKAAQLEGSKAFSKELMAKCNIPTAAYKKFTDADEASEYVNALDDKTLVIKADGLAAGKGVIICEGKKEAFEAIELILTDKEFGEAGSSIVIEEFLLGEEASFLAITDGVTVIPLAPAQDHKPIFDDDKGPNTGGMGAYSPAPVLTKELQEHVMDTVMIPAVKGMADDGIPYKGILYAGLMITDDGPKVLEFNCRFGDPEAQPLLLRLTSDLGELLLKAVNGQLSDVTLEWDPRPAVCVVLSSKGYPGSYEKGDIITGLEKFSHSEEIVVFHAGTSRAHGKIVTSGGRVLGITALGEDIEKAIENAYNAVKEVNFSGAYHRTDIGKKALNRSR